MKSAAPSRILESLGLSLIGLIYAIALMFFGASMVGAGHGTDFFFALAASPCLFLSNGSHAGLIWVCLFWSMLFGALPWCHKKGVLLFIVSGLVLHMIGGFFWWFKEGNYPLDDLNRVAQSMLGSVVLASVIYVGGLGLVVGLLKRWRTRP